MSGIMTTVTMRLIGHPSPGAVQAWLPFAKVDGKDVVIRSPLGVDASLNDHLIWFWGHLNSHRRLLKRITADGANLIFSCQVPRGSIRLLPNAAEMLHLLGAELCLEAK